MLCTKIILSRNRVYYIFFPLPVVQIWSHIKILYFQNSDCYCIFAYSDPNHTSKFPLGTFYLIKSCVHSRCSNFEIGLGFWVTAFLHYWNMWKHLKHKKNSQISLEGFIILTSNIHLCLVFVLIFEVFGLHVIAQLFLEFYIFEKALSWLKGSNVDKMVPKAKNTKKQVHSS